MDQTRGLAFVLVVIWTSILVALASQPLARGEAHSCGYNYRPWQPKFAKSPTNQEADMIGRKFAELPLIGPC